jgi:phospholipase/carboxylesterase
VHVTDHRLLHRVRPAATDPSGALVLLHGRGADEHDLFPLFDILDPERRLHGFAPRGPLALPPGGAHWYRVLRVGWPDPATFHPTFDELQSWFDMTLGDHGLTPDRTVIGGFSQGAVMSYALSLAAGRPRPAGLIALSGFMPTVPDLQLSIEGLSGWPVAIGHGEHDPVIGVGWGREASRALEDAGAAVTYRESPIDHRIDPAFLGALREWLGAVLP